MTKNKPPTIFDRALVRRRRARAAGSFLKHGFLHERAMDDIVDRLETVKRDFQDAMFFGAGNLTERLTPACGVEAIIHGDCAPARLGQRGVRAVFDEEAMPLQEASLDLFISLLTLHSANDLVGALTQARRVLRPDGLFIAAVFGESTLSVLKRALYQAETEFAGGVTVRIAPFATVQDFGQVLSRAGFALPVVDVDNARVSYEHPYRLLRDLRGMGETRAMSSHTTPLARQVLRRALDIFSASGGEENFDIVYLTGWAPHMNQQKPLRPGTGTNSMADAVKKLS